MGGAILGVSSSFLINSFILTFVIKAIYVLMQEADQVLMTYLWT